MIFTARMKQLVAVVLDSDVDRVTKELLRQGVLHFVSISEIQRDWKNKVNIVTPEISEAQIGEIRKRIESFFGLLKYYPGSGRELDVSRLKAVDLDQTNKTLDKLSLRLQGIRNRQSILQKEILKLEDIRRQMELFGDISAGIQAGSQYSFLNIQTGSIQSSRLEGFTTALKIIPSVQLSFQEEDNRTNLLLITMKRDDKQVNTVLDQYGWTDVELPKEKLSLKEEVMNDLEIKLNKFRSEQDKLNVEVRDLLEKELDSLKEMWSNLRLNELFYKIQSFFSKTSRTMIFSGWLPESRRKALEQGLRRVTGGRCYFEWHDAQEVDDDRIKAVPVQFKNPKFLAPFQMLVKNYSIPEYGTVDPTPLVAIAYLLMFGLMFGDAGHGAVLFILGLIASLVDKSKKEGRHNLFRLITWCGGAAIVTGILFGSYFGMQWFKPLWFDYHGIITGHASHSGYVKDVYGILVITIYFGISVIAVGLLINWINHIARRHWFKLLFDKGGLIGAWIYGAGVYTAWYFVNHSYKEMPGANLLFLILGLPVILFMLKPPLEFLIDKRKDPGKKFTLLTPVDFFMEWIVEMLEISSGYLANTLSFMRVAGLGIAHVSLMIAFFEIAGMVGGSTSGSYNIWSYIILIFGNALVIALEGLTAGIQSLRLNYYEFFSKYFIGSGRAYEPVSLYKRS